MVLMEMLPTFSLGVAIICLGRSIYHLLEKETTFKEELLIIFISLLSFIFAIINLTMPVSYFANFINHSDFIIYFSFLLASTLINVYYLCLVGYKNRK